ncbi:hypothetical protein ebA6568 [Aromatoleum aromaticum EbN1]|uniref:Uncharacterized protein n=1 Tax=Aromatoleum aromaticum (strain DSM 19018 / LMG 30748 / EbN1) TaxID=76114 RepID=Q5NYI6_AROAE|nr:hypothetical protein ebA6568 [Aromatoleum aromaticum EbN1]
MPLGARSDRPGARLFPAVRFRRRERSREAPRGPEDRRCSRRCRWHEARRSCEPHRNSPWLHPSFNVLSIFLLLASRWRSPHRFGLDRRPESVRAGERCCRLMRHLNKRRAACFATVEKFASAGARRALLAIPQAPSSIPIALAGIRITGRAARSMIRTT